MGYRFRTLAAMALAGSLLLAACGDGSDDDPEPTSTAGDSTATVPGGWGPDPRLGGNVIDISPPHASTVRSSQTMQTNPGLPGGICFEVAFEGIENPSLQWFQFAIDGVDKTAPIPSEGEGVFTWFQSGEGAIGCFGPPEPLEPGRHQVAVLVQNPNNFNEPPRQSVAWEFEVE